MKRMLVALSVLTALAFNMQASFAVSSNTASHKYTGKHMMKKMHHKHHMRSAHMTKHYRKATKSYSTGAACPLVKPWPLVQPCCPTGGACPLVTPCPCQNGGYSPSYFTHD